MLGIRAWNTFEKGNYIRDGPYGGGKPELTAAHEGSEGAPTAASTQRRRRLQPRSRRWQALARGIPAAEQESPVKEMQLLSRPNIKQGELYFSREMVCGIDCAFIRTFAAFC